MLPASRSPRRLRDRDEADGQHADPDRHGRRGAGTAEAICSTADDVDTATVRL